MFTKIKSAVASFMARIFHRMLEMSVELEAANALKTVEADIKAGIEDVKTEVQAIAAKIDPAPFAAQAAPVASPAPAPVAALTPVPGAPAPAVSVSSIISKVKSVLAVVDTVPSAFDTLAAPAIKAAGSDIDAALLMFEKMLDLAGVKSALWDEVVAAAKAI